jgi:hypothetical protein
MDRQRRDDRKIMANDTLLNTPVLWINKYLKEKIALLTEENIDIPFFPSSPTDLSALTETFPASGGCLATWDRLIKMNRKGFPHIKCEQLLYYFYATAEESAENMIQIQEAVLRLMDRYDETAEEVNNWCSNRQVRLDDGTLIDNMFYFHNFKVYQLEETRDIIDFGTARTYGGNKIIIDFDYHQMPDLTTNDWAPEKLATKEII